VNDIFVVDAVGYLFRSYYAIRGMSTPSGESTNALFGFIRSMQKIIKDFSPNHICAVFDGPDNKKSRTEMYEHYKANRTGMPEDLIPQLGWAMEYCEYAGIPLLSIPGVEADDTIGTITKWADSHGANIHICSSDKDLCQLVKENVELIYTHKDNTRVDASKVKEIYGVKPTQIVDYLAIVGDTSDNIPGLEGFGPKTAAQLLQEFQTLEAILDNPNAVKGAKKQETIKNGREIAELSKKLATIDTSIDIPSKFEFYQLKQPDFGKLAAMYNRLHYRTLLKELDEEIHRAPPKEETEQLPQSSYAIVEDEAGVKAMIASFSSEMPICFDVETTMLDPIEAKLVGIGIGSTLENVYYVPWKEEYVSLLRPFFENDSLKFFAHNIKYDMHVLANHGITVKNQYFDTMLASYLLTPQNNRHNLDDLTLAHFEYKKTPITALIGTGKNQISMEEVPVADVAKYCAEDVEYTIRLYDVFQSELKAHDLEHLFFSIEMPLVNVLFSMERHGIFLDTEILRAKSVSLREHIQQAQKAVFDIAGEEFNLNSPKQLSEVLFTKLGIPSPTKKLSTRADILEGLKHKYPIVEQIITYRILEKLRSTYVDSLPTQVSPKTGRVHCSFNQSVTATGRLSSTNPNLQNIPVRTPEGRAIREAFRPEKSDWCFLSADYSQIELRLLAHFSEEQTLIDAFNNDEDIHRAVAAEVFAVSPEEVTKAMRSQAKVVNFGIIYGQSSFGLSQQLGIDVKEAKSFIDQYFSKYPQVREYLEESKRKAAVDGCAFTLFGRRRPIPEIHSKNGMLRSQAERLAVNTPLQGSQADIIKMAMIEIEKQNVPGSMILQIHDELIFELPDSAVEEAQKMITGAMETIVDLKVPLKVNIAIGKNWGEC